MISSKFPKFLVCLIFLSGFGASEVWGATLLNGQVGMMGRGTLNAPLATATSFSGFSNARVGYGMGDYEVPTAIGLNTPVSLSLGDFTGSPAVPVVLWEVVTGGGVYSFEVESLSFERFILGENVYLTISGVGRALLDGGRSTSGVFCFSTQQCVDSTDLDVTWSAETVVRGVPEENVPEGGGRWVILLFGILGIQGLRKFTHHL